MGLGLSRPLLKILPIDIVTGSGLCLKVDRLFQGVVSNQRVGRAGQGRGKVGQTWSGVG